MKNTIRFILLIALVSFVISSCAQPDINTDIEQRLKKDIAITIQDNKDYSTYKYITDLSETKIIDKWGDVDVTMSVSIPKTESLKVNLYGLKTFSPEEVENIVGYFVGGEPVLYEIGQPSIEYYKENLEFCYHTIQGYEKWKEEIAITGPQQHEAYNGQTGENYIETVDEAFLEERIEQEKKAVQEYLDIIENYDNKERKVIKLQYTTENEGSFYEERKVLRASFNVNGEQDYVLSTSKESKLLRIGKRDMMSNEERDPVEFGNLNDDGSYPKIIGLNKKEAQKLSEEFVSKIAPDMIFRKMYPSVAYAEEEVPEYAWQCYFTRQIDDVEVAFEDHDIVPEELNTEAVAYECLTVAVSNDGIVGLTWWFPLKYEDTISENVTMMPMEDVLGIAKNYFSIQAYGKMNITDMKLTYTRIDKRDDKGHYYYVPVWDFYGNTPYSDPWIDQSIRSLLTINALDGTIIDRSLGY